jgi:hypothetical protein
MAAMSTNRNRLLMGAALGRGADESGELGTSVGSIPATDYHEGPRDQASGIRAVSGLSLPLPETTLEA